MIYNSLTVNYTTSVAFNSLSFLSVTHLFYKTQRSLCLPLDATAPWYKQHLEFIILLEKFWTCLGM